MGRGWRWKWWGRDIHLLLLHEEKEEEEEIKPSAKDGATINGRGSAFGVLLLLYSTQAIN